MKTKFDKFFRLALVVLAAALLWPYLAKPQGQTGASVIEFADETFPARETQPRAVIRVRRTGSTNETVSVNYATRDTGPVVAGVDYQATAGTLTFPPGTVEASFTVTILNNPAATGDQTVLLALSDPSSGAVLGQMTEARLLIEDKDSPKAPWVAMGLDRVAALKRVVAGIPLWQYLASLIYLILAIAAAKATDWLARGLLKKWAARTATKVDDVLLELLRGPLKIIAFVILIHIGLRLFAWPAWLRVYLANGLKLVVAVSVTWMAVRLVDVFGDVWRQRAKDSEDHAFNAQLLPILRNILRTVVVIIGALITLDNLGFKIIPLLASLSVPALAVGLAAQDTLANMFGAIAVLTDKPFRIGDAIKLDNVEGTVELIGLRSTRVRTADGHLVCIPNKTVGNATITNIAERPNMRTVMNLGLTYDTSVAKLQRALVTLDEVYRQHSATHDVVVSFNRFADSALNIQVIHWWKGTDARQHLAALQELNLAVKERFEQEGIEFAFPSQTVYVKQPPAT